VNLRALRLLRLAFAGLALAWLASLTGCATTAPGPDGRPVQRVDPWESWNRKVYNFNDALDTAVLKPVATTYRDVVPQPTRRGISNIFGNVSDLWSAFNNVLQGKVNDGMQDVMRVTTNTIFGLGGFFDVATEMGLDRHNEDLGQTFGRWGIASGPYVVWPFFGPSTLRDSFALPVDRSVSPALAFNDSLARYAVVGVGFVNERAALLGASGMLDDIALDKYTFIRDAYLQRRRSLVYDGEVPDSKDERYDQEEVPAAVSAGASAPAADSAPSPVAPASAPKP
jgi:phospholipid-binding lipoprotein MlaA